MRFMRNKAARTFLMLGVAAVAAVGVQAYTAANTVPASDAGSGSGAVTGYTATNIDYDLNAVDPLNVDTFKFVIAPTTATEVKVRFTAAGAWFSCTNTAGAVSCDTSAGSLAVSGIDDVTVVAVQ